MALIFNTLQNGKMLISYKTGNCSEKQGICRLFASHYDRINRILQF